MSAIALDSLIAEAKERARRRRFVLAAMGLAVAAAAVGLELSSSTRAPLVAAPPCQTEQLHGALRFGGVAAGTAYELLAFTNASGVACTLSGWPAIRLVLRDGRVVAPRPRDLIAMAYRKDRPPPLPRISLRPGATATESVFEADGTGLSHVCPTTQAVLVTPPGAHSPLTLRASIFFCGPRWMYMLPIGRKP